MATHHQHCKENNAFSPVITEHKLGLPDRRCAFCYIRPTTRTLDNTVVEHLFKIFWKDTFDHTHLKNECHRVEDAISGLVGKSLYLRTLPEAHQWDENQMFANGKIYYQETCQFQTSALLHTVITIDYASISCWL